MKAYLNIKQKCIKQKFAVKLNLFKLKKKLLKYVKLED